MISQCGTTDHVVLTIHIVADNKFELIDRMSKIQDTIDVFDERGDSMLLPKLDLELL